METQKIANPETPHGEVEKLVYSPGARETDYMYSVIFTTQSTFTQQVLHPSTNTLLAIWG